MLQYMQYNIPYLHSTRFESFGYPLKIYLEKHHINNNTHDNYYLKLYFILPNGKEILIGYLYFFLNFELHISRFIGMYINPEFRGKGLASLFIATWIDLSFQNDLTNLSINRKQRKPFFLYLLKKFSFEIDDISIYETSESVIYICKKEDSTNKTLFFKNKKQEEIFRKSHVFERDNYEIIDSLQNVNILDRVVLNKRYNLNNQDKSYQKCLDTFKRHQK